MTTNRAGEREGISDDRRSTFLELFFDLAFVVALFQLSHGLLRNLRWSGAYQTLILLLAVWFVWLGTQMITDRLDPRQEMLQLVVITALVGSLVMAAALPDAFRQRGVVFAGAFIASDLGRNALVVLIAPGDEVRRDAKRPTFWSGVSAVAWVSGALVHGTARAVLWTLALAISWTAFDIGFPTPWLGRLPTPQLPVVAEHLAERYRQFLIIALGELVLVTGLALGGSGFELDRGAAFAASITTTVLMWRIYIFRAGRLLSAAIAAVAKPARLAEAAAYAHLVMVAGIVVSAVGAEVVIAHPSGHTKSAWVAVILGGPALFLAGRGGFEYAVFTRVSRDRWIGLLALAALAPVMLHAPPLVVAFGPAAVLFAIAISDAARARRRPSEPPSPPKGAP
jgi:low temperature requirement protein LtrA